MSLDINVSNILKEYYAVSDLSALIARASPALGRWKSERVGGKWALIPMAVYGSGAVTSDYTQVTAQATDSFMGVNMQVTPGRLFSSFVVDPEEHLSSQGDDAAFKSIFAIRAFLALDDMRRVLASAMYRTGYLELGQVLTGGVDTSAYLYVDVAASTAAAMSPNTQILFAASTPGGTLRSANAVIVSTIETLQASGNVRVTFTSAFPPTVVATDYLLIKGGRDGSSNPLAPRGLGAWIPSTANRTGATWTTLIGTSFFGLNRSVAPERLAGQFTLRNSGNGETYTDALMRSIKQQRRAGGNPDLILVNDDDFEAVLNEALKNRTFFQAFDAASNARGQKLTQGLNSVNLAFSTNWISQVIDDPFCPKGTAYVLDSSTLRIYSISNSAPILQDMSISNEPGAPDIAGAKEMSKDYGFLKEDMYTTSDVDLQSGKGLRIDLQLFAQFVILRPAHNGVVVF